MSETNQWDWDTSQKEIPMAEWHERYGWVEEPYVSPDGEKVAAIVNTGEMSFNVCVNGDTWESDYDKIWHLRFLPSGALTALISDQGEWTVAIDGTPWENRFGYVWNPIYSQNAGSVAVAAQQDMRYCMVLDGQPWDETYANMTYFALSPCGTKTAAAVQVVLEPVGWAA